MADENTVDEPVVTSNEGLDANEDQATDAEQVTEEKETKETTTDEGEEAEGKETDTGEEDADEKKTEKKRRDKRTRRSRRYREQQRQQQEEIQRLREENAYLKGVKDASSRDTTQPDEVKRPVRDDFDTYDEFVEAVADWKIEQRARSSEQDEADPRSEKETKATTQDDIPTIHVDDKDRERFDTAGQQRYGEDFDDMLEAAANNEFAMSVPMAEYTFESDHSADIAMYLYDHPKDAARIAELSVSRQIKEMQAIENKIAEANKPVKKVSKAPAPENPERSNDGIRDIDFDKMSMEEFVKRRNKELYGA